MDTQQCLVCRAAGLHHRRAWRLLRVCRWRGALDAAATDMIRSDGTYRARGHHMRPGIPRVMSHTCVKAVGGVNELTNELSRTRMVAHRAGRNCDLRNSCRWPMKMSRATFDAHQAHSGDGEGRRDCQEAQTTPTGSACPVAACGGHKDKNRTRIPRRSKWNSHVAGGHLDHPCVFVYAPMNNLPKFRASYDPPRCRGSIGAGCRLNRQYGKI